MSLRFYFFVASVHYGLNKKRRKSIMNKLLREHADVIIASAINAVKPDEAVCRALAGQKLPTA